MTALPPAAALAHAARLLAEYGFADAVRNTRGDTVYLHRPGCAFALRLSNHARTSKQRQRRTDVLTSLVIRTPRSDEQVAVLVAAALREFEAALGRRVPLPPLRERVAREAGRERVATMQDMALPSPDPR